MENRYDNFASYIQENPEYYLDKFSKMEVSGKQTSWNWAAFLFTDAWLLYRKMYKWFFIVLFAQLLISLFIPFLSIFAHILVGLYGNHLYKDHIEQLSTKGAMLPFDQQKAYKAKYGGTSTKAICAYLIISLILSVYSTLIV